MEVAQSRSLPLSSLVLGGKTGHRVCRARLPFLLGALHSRPACDSLVKTGGAGHMLSPRQSGSPTGTETCRGRPACRAGAPRVCSGTRPSALTGSSLTLVQLDRRAQGLTGRPAGQGAGGSGTRWAQWLVVSRKVQTAVSSGTGCGSAQRRAKGPARSAGCHRAVWTLPKDRPHPQDSQCLPAEAPGVWQGPSALWAPASKATHPPKLSLPGGSQCPVVVRAVSVQGLQLLPRAERSRGRACISSWKESGEEQRDGWQGTVRLVETGRGCLEDSGLILGAEAPLGVGFGVHNPGDAGMGLGIWVHVGRF